MTVTSDVPDGLVGSIRFSPLGPVEPLPGRPAPGRAASVPEALTEAVFGGPEGTWTFALLDAAKVPDLPEMLAGTDLEYRCLYLGEAAEDYGATAPWLVRLTPEAALTRALFTEDAEAPVPWHLWAKAPGVLLRCAAPFDAVLAHLRKFTRLQRPDGAWLYFRFWERQVLPALATDGAPELANALLGPVAGTPLTWLIPDHQRARVLMIEKTAETTRPSGPPRLTEAAQAALDRATARRRYRDELWAALTKLPPGIQQAYAQDKRLHDLWSRLRQAGFAQPEQRIEAMSLYIRMAERKAHDRGWAILTQEGPGAGVKLWQLQQAVDAEDVV